MNPKDAATSRGRRNSVAASSRGVGFRRMCEFPFNAADMDRTAKPITPGGLYGNSPDFEDAISKCCHSFLLKLRWGHIPAHRVGGNIFADLRNPALGHINKVARPKMEIFVQIP